MSDQNWETSEPSTGCLWAFLFCVPAFLSVSVSLGLCLPLLLLDPCCNPSAGPASLTPHVRGCVVLCSLSSISLWQVCGLVNVSLSLSLSVVSGVCVLFLNNLAKSLLLCLCVCSHWPLTALVCGAMCVRKCSCVLCVSHSLAVSVGVCLSALMASQELLHYILSGASHQGVMSQTGFSGPWRPQGITSSWLGCAFIGVSLGSVDKIFHCEVI